jgi:hypothetical protein
MDDIRLTDRLTNMLTDTGAAAMLTVIKTTRNIGTGAHPINHWFIDWTTGKMFTSDQFQAGLDAGGLPEIIAVNVSATIPAHMILAPDTHEHQLLNLHEGKVWSVEDLACHDLRTFQLLEFNSSMETVHRVHARMKIECPDHYRVFCGAPNRFYEPTGTQHDD